MEDPGHTKFNLTYPLATDAPAEFEVRSPVSHLAGQEVKLRFDILKYPSLIIQLGL